MNIEEMTGLEFLDAMRRDELTHPPICKTIPMRIDHVEEGRIVFHVSASDDHINSMGGIHGGFAATVLDTVTGCAVHTLLGANIGYATIDLNIKMIRPIPKGEELIADGRIINMSKSLGISEGSIKNREGKLLATGTATCMVLK